MSDRMKKAMANELGISFKKEKPVIEQKEVMKPKDDCVDVILHEDNTESSDDAKKDYKLARGTLRKVIKQGNSVMEELKAVAVQTENPRAYEVFATMIKTIAETTTHLYDLQIKTKELNEGGKNIKNDGNINIDKAVFVGTSAELLKQIKEKE